VLDARSINEAIMSSYTERVLAPALKHLEQTQVLPDVFTRFGVTPTSDETTIRTAAVAAVAEWGRLIQNPKYKALVAKLLVEKDRSLAMVLDPNHRAAAQREIKQRQAQAVAQLDDDIRHLTTNGYLPAAKFAALRDAYAGKFEVSAIVARLRVPLQQTVEQLAGRPLAACPMREYEEIKRHLGVLEQPSFFAWAGTAPEASARYTGQRIVTLRSRVRAESVTPKKTAAEAILRLERVFTDGVPSSYTAARTWDFANLLRQRLPLLETQGVISATQLKRFHEWCNEAGFPDLSDKERIAVLLAVAGECGVEVQLTGRSTATSGPMRTSTPAPRPQFRVVSPREITVNLREIRRALDMASVPPDVPPAPTTSPSLLVRILHGAVRGYRGYIETVRTQWKRASTMERKALVACGALLAGMVALAIAIQIMVVVWVAAVYTGLGAVAIWVMGHLVAAIVCICRTRRMISPTVTKQLTTLGPMSYTQAKRHPILGAWFPSPGRFVAVSIVTTSILFLAGEAALYVLAYSRFSLLHTAGLLAGFIGGGMVYHRHLVNWTTVTWILPFAASHRHAQLVPATPSAA
jgi:hypothetical protein